MRNARSYINQRIDTNNRLVITDFWHRVDWKSGKNYSSHKKTEENQLKQLSSMQKGLRVKIYLTKKMDQKTRSCVQVDREAESVTWCHEDDGRRCKHQQH